MDVSLGFCFNKISVKFTATVTLKRIDDVSGKFNFEIMSLIGKISTAAIIV